MASVQRRTLTQLSLKTADEEPMNLSAMWINEDTAAFSNVHHGTNTTFS